MQKMVELCWCKINEDQGQEASWGHRGDAGHVTAQAWLVQPQFLLPCPCVVTLTCVVTVPSNTTTGRYS